MKINTRFDPPPIPMRDFDWHATEDDYEPGAPIGYGPTEKSAIAAIMGLIAERDASEADKCVQIDYLPPTAPEKP